MKTDPGVRSSTMTISRSLIMAVLLFLYSGNLFFAIEATTDHSWLNALVAGMYGMAIMLLGSRE